MSLVKNLDNIFKKGVIGRVRKAQEDSHDIALKTPNGDVFVVCDGMGGHVGGAKASSLAVESIISYLKAEKYADPQTALDGALQFANMQILGFATSNPEYKGMGTTACIVLFQEDVAYIAHVGDSRIYLYLGKEKQLHRITKDHSFVQTLVDAGEITDEQAEHHPNKNRILKALGIKPELHPSFNKAKPKNGDIFLICSDGLSGMIPDSTIEKVLEQDSMLEAKGELLIDLAMQGETVQPGGQDNCTLELIQIDNSSCKKSEFTSYNPIKSKKKRTKKSHLKIIAIVAIAIALVVAIGFVSMYIKNKKIEKQQKSRTENLKKQKTNYEYELENIEMIMNGFRSTQSKAKQTILDNQNMSNSDSLLKEAKIREKAMSDSLRKYEEYSISIVSKIDSLNQLIIKNNESNNSWQK